MSPHRRINTFDDNLSTPPTYVHRFDKNIFYVPKIHYDEITSQLENIIAVGEMDAINEQEKDPYYIKHPTKKAEYIAILKRFPKYKDISFIDLNTKTNTIQVLKNLIETEKLTIAGGNADVVDGGNAAVQEVGNADVQEVGNADVQEVGNAAVQDGDNLET